MEYFNKIVEPLLNIIKDVYIVIKINDFEKFDEIFPDNDNLKLHPSWIYLDKKGIIKINVGTEIVEYLNKQKLFEYTIDDFLDLKENNEYLIDIDIKTFKPFSDYFIYIDYNLHNKKYTNFYNKSDQILSTQFLYKNSKNFDAMYITIEYETEKGYHSMDITKFIKLFTNNDTAITIESMMLFHHLNVEIDNCIYKMHYNYGTVYCLPKKEIINLKK
jgi:hypothetical protein